MKNNRRSLPFHIRPASRFINPPNGRPALRTALHTETLPGFLPAGMNPPGGSLGYHAPNRGFDVVTLPTQHFLVFVLAVAMDCFLPEPPNRIHPVVWMGVIAHRLARIAPTRPAPALVFGGLITLLVVGGSTVAAWLAMSALESLGTVAYLVGGTVVLRTTFTVRGLSRAARQTERSLEQGRLDEARTGLKSLVSRDPASLDRSLMSAAAIESVAENTTDSYIGPWMAFAVFGIPGAVAYRAVNTLDSMLGYRGAYQYLGKTSARLDDLVNLVPARVSALLVLLGGASARWPAGRGWRIMIRDRGLTASPNAGWTMSAMAGLLGVRLDKPGHYCLGRGLPPPDTEDIGRAVVVILRTAAVAFLATLGLLALRVMVIG